jgi:hypothetical protein
MAKLNKRRAAAIPVATKAGIQPAVGCPGHNLCMIGYSLVQSA